MQWSALRLSQVFLINFSTHLSFFRPSCPQHCLSSWPGSAYSCPLRSDILLSPRSDILLPPGVRYFPAPQGQILTAPMARYVAAPCCQLYTTCPIGKIFFCLLRPDIFLPSKVRYLAAHRVRYFLGLLGQIIPPRSHILICTYSEHVFFITYLS